MGVKDMYSTCVCVHSGGWPYLIRQRHLVHVLTVHRERDKQTKMINNATTGYPHVHNVHTPTSHTHSLEL